MEELEEVLELVELVEQPLTVEALELLNEHREQAVPGLVFLLTEDRRRVVQRALEALVYVEATEAEVEIQELLEHKSAKVRRKAVLALGRIFSKKPPSLDTLLLLEERLFLEDSSTVETAIAEALSMFPGAAGLKTLLRCAGAAGDGLARRILARAEPLLAEHPQPDLEEFLGNLHPETLETMGRCAQTEPLRSLCRGLGTVQAPTNDLEEFGKVLEFQARDYDVDPHLFNTALERLTGDGPGHLIVVGGPGVGKSAFLERVFDELQDRGVAVLRTTTANLMAGTKYIGEWQTRLRDLVHAIKRPRRVVLFIQDPNNLPFTGVYEGSTANFANYLKPYMEDAEITVVGESTPEALQTGLARKPDFRRLFLELKLAPPEGPLLRRRLNQVVQQLSFDFNREISLPEPALEYLIEMAGHYVPGMEFPGKAVLILKGAVQRHAESEGPVELSSDDLVAALASSTGLPAWLVEDSTPLDVEATEEFFNERVVGQLEPVKTIVDMITLVKAGLSDPTRPLGVFLFVGPTGVGKTELAKSLAEYVFGSRERMVRIDMSEYKDYDAYQRLIGTGYGVDKDGVLTGKVKQHPFSVILLDEFEKAHPNVYDLMLGLFDDGRLTTARGETVSFCRSIIIMTSNLGQSNTSGSLGILARSTVPSDRDVLRSVEEYFSPEFLNRIQVSLFRPLDLSAMQAIAAREVQSALKRSGIARRSLVVDVGDTVVSLLLRKGFTPRFGARPLKRAVEQFLLLPIARQLVQNPGSGGILQVRARGDEVVARLVQEKRPDFKELIAHSGGPDDQDITQLEKRLESCQKMAKKAKVEERYDELMAQAQKPEFWEANPEVGKHFAAQLHRLELLRDNLKELNEQVPDLKSWLEDLKRRKRADLTGAGKRYRRLCDQLELLELRLSTRGEASTAYLQIRPLSPGPGSNDTLRLMLEMYQGWAQRCDCEVFVQNDPRKHDVQNLQLTVTGPFAYGLFRGERGLHRFSLRKGPRRRDSALVRVEVVPEAPLDFKLVKDDLTLSSGSVRTARGRYGDKRRSWARALHLPSVTVAEGLNELSPSDNEKAAVELLRALVAHQEPEGEARIVRSYYLAPDNEVLDEVSGLRSRRLDEVLSGNLQPFHHFLSMQH